MKSITLTLLPRHTGKENYKDGRKCPIASAMRHKGFFNIYVKAYSWSACRFSWEWPFLHFLSGNVPYEINRSARYVWQVWVIERPIIFQLPVNE